MRSLGGCVASIACLAQCAAAAELYAHSRADLWRSDLPESGTEDPVNGRRFHIVVDGVTVKQEDLGSVTVNGQEGLALTDDLTYFDWFRAHSNTAAGQLWLSFHTRNEAWAALSAMDVRVTAKDGTQLVAGQVAPGAAGVSLSYVTTRKAGAEAVLHLHGFDQDGSVDRVVFDGQEVPLPSWARMVPANGHVVLVVPGVSKKPGDVWTVVIFSGSQALGYGGRVMPERFPVEAWPTSSDCPFPGANGENAAYIKDIGIDSVFYNSGKMSDKCGKDFKTVIENLSTAEDGWFHLLASGEDGGDDLSKLSAEARGRVDAALIGDEVDGKVDAEHLRKKLQRAQDLMAKFPEVPIYQGSKTTHNVGAFAGIADIQGSDAYAAACAPTMVEVVRTLPLQYPYYYLRNARDNHAPLTFWGYSQLYSDAWSYQADVGEIVTQIGQVVLSGSKGLMFFQSNVGHMKEHRADTIRSVLGSIHQVKEIIRVGDIRGMPFTVSSTLNKQVMAETILAPEKLLVTVVSTNADGYSNLLCHVGTSKHWTFKEHTVETLTLDVSAAPGVVSLTNWQEATEAGLVPLSDVTVQGESGRVVLSNIQLGTRLTTRFFVADVQPASADAVALTV